MKDLFRKTSLEKLSSPEQLDKMIVITPPSFWIALTGAGLMIVAVCLGYIWQTSGIIKNHIFTGEKIACF